MLNKKQTEFNEARLKYLNTESYRNQLLAQIDERKARELKDRQKQLEEDRLNEKIQDRYYYFEREGGGAPLRDSFGHIIANRALQFENLKKKMQFKDSDTNEVNYNKMTDINEKLKKEWYNDLKLQIEMKQSSFTY